MPTDLPEARLSSAQARRLLTISVITETIRPKATPFASTKQVDADAVLTLATWVIGDDVPDTPSAPTVGALLSALSEQPGVHLMEPFSARSPGEAAMKFLDRFLDENIEQPTPEEIYEYNVRFAEDENDDAETIATEQFHPEEAKDLRAGVLTSQYRVLADPVADPNYSEGIRVFVKERLIDSPPFEWSVGRLDEVQVVCASCTTKHRHLTSK
jgi:hypothetical protein